MTQKMIKDIGDTVELKCTILHAAEFPILWFKIDRENKTQPVPLGCKNTKLINDPRFSLTVLPNIKENTIIYILQVSTDILTLYKVFEMKTPNDIVTSLHIVVTSRIYHVTVKT